MLINTEQVDYFMNDDQRKSEDWIFRNIIEKQYLYQETKLSKSRIKEIQKLVIEALSNFKPLNEEIFDLLFKRWRELEKTVNVYLVTGCPSVYDMMEREGKIYIDLQNIDKYLKAGWNPNDLLAQLLTHEFTHICINDDYRLSDNPTYLEQLDYSLFQEGFAHYISYKFTEEKYLDIYNLSCLKLAKASIEKDPFRQEQYLIESDTSDEDYWDKYGSIASKLYLYYHQEDLEKIYKEGPLNFHQKIINHSLTLTR